ncbi:hypothetical protein LPJ61_000145 [Coemansia biformis]|uniref:Uncharacterized protein n=1 Tax=Coemansia biformis TaxID=1286918 RepID=A0A9W7YIZ1_9FUNG|nr:hypothetical protein LPJ61_000145 [Coemansia biformis]
MAAGGIPQYILERGDSAREYRRRSSCISRTSDSSVGLELPGIRHLPPDSAAAADKSAVPGDLEAYLFAESARRMSTSGGGAPRYPHDAQTASEKHSAEQAPSAALESLLAAAKRPPAAMLTASVPSYILSSGYSAQQSRRHGASSGRRLSQASDNASVCSLTGALGETSDEELGQIADAPTSDIKEVLGYVHTPPHWMAQGYDIPRLVRF